MQQEFSSICKYCQIFFQKFLFIRCTTNVMSHTTGNSQVCFAFQFQYFEILHVFDIGQVDARA